MAHVVDPTAPLWTAADLVQQLGPIPLHRVVSQRIPRSATIDDVIRLNDHEDRLCELIDGTLIQKTVGAYESYIAGRLTADLLTNVQENRLGIVLGVDGMMQLFPDQVRIPDASFVSWERLQGSGFPDEAVPEIVPDLAAEVISRGNTREEMDRELREYFAAGVRLVWYVYPETKTVHVYTSPEQASVLTGSETLTGGAVLPDFTLPLRDLFTVPAKPESN